ncbi:MAG: tyrosine-type recombinase/integrase [Acidimicrobiales bacterium]
MHADVAPADGDPERLIVSFGRHLRAANRSVRTIEKYLLAARQFAAFCAANDGPTVGAAIRRRDVEAYIADLLERFKPGTAVTRYQDLRVLFAWLVDEEEIATSPMARMKPPILPEVPVPVLSATEQRALLATCADKDFDNRRDTAIIRLFLDTGMRLAELAGLRLDDPPGGAGRPGRRLGQGRGRATPGARGPARLRASGGRGPRRGPLVGADRAARPPGSDPPTAPRRPRSLFALVSVPAPASATTTSTWRCGDCDGLVLDSGPGAGHPVDAEPGHREDCGRLAAEVSQYVAGLDADDQLSAGIARVGTNHVRELEAWDRPIELDGPGLELW